MMSDKDNLMLFFIFLVNTNTLSETPIKRETWGEEDSSRDPLYRLSSFLYIVDRIGILLIKLSEKCIKPACFIHLTILKLYFRLSFVKRTFT